MRAARARKWAPLAAAVGLVTTLFVALPAGSSSAATTNYTITNDIFANPDRGFYSRFDVVNDRDYSRARNAGNVVHSYVRLDSYRNSSIPTSFLNQLEAGLNDVRGRLPVEQGSARLLIAGVRSSFGDGRGRVKAKM